MDSSPRRTRWCALLIIGVVTALLCIGVVSVFVGAPSAPLDLAAVVALVFGLMAAVVLGVGMAKLVLRRRPRNGNQSET